MGDSASFWREEKHIVGGCQRGERGNRGYKGRSINSASGLSVSISSSLQPPIRPHLYRSFPALLFRLCRVVPTSRSGPQVVVHHCWISIHSSHCPPVPGPILAIPLTGGHRHPPSTILKRPHPPTPPPRPPSRRIPSEQLQVGCVNVTCSRFRRRQPCRRPANQPPRRVSALALTLGVTGAPFLQSAR